MRAYYRNKHEVKIHTLLSCFTWSIDMHSRVVSFCGKRIMSIYRLEGCEICSELGGKISVSSLGFEPQSVQHKPPIL
jgi:hypothetical protein